MHRVEVGGTRENVEESGDRRGHRGGVPGIVHNGKPIEYQLCKTDMVVLQRAQEGGAVLLRVQRAKLYSKSIHRHLGSTANQSSVDGVEGLSYIFAAKRAPTHAEEPIANTFQGKADIQLLHAQVQGDRASTCHSH